MRYLVGLDPKTKPLLAKEVWMVAVGDDVQPQDGEIIVTDEEQTE